MNTEKVADLGRLRDLIACDLTLDVSEVRMQSDRLQLTTATNKQEKMCQSP